MMLPFTDNSNLNMRPIEIYHRRLHRLGYYARHAYLLLPYTLRRRDFSDIEHAFRLLPNDVQHYLNERIQLCNRQNDAFNLQPSGNESVVRIDQFRLQHNSTYFFDLADYLSYFPAHYEFAYEFGDVTHVPSTPTLVKSRPILTNNDKKNNKNSILMRLDSVRHFYTYPDTLPFTQKQAKLVWRGAAHQSQRLTFLQRFHQHPLCDVGCIHKKSLGQPYHREFLSIKQQQAYRYILSIEGNDVATNLKWILASHSLCFMTRPKFETWFLESQLQPHVHYVLLEDDYSDLDEKLAFYQAHPDAAQKIIAAGQAYIRPFMNLQWERIANVLVLKKYFNAIQAFQAA